MKGIRDRSGPATVARRRAKSAPTPAIRLVALDLDGTLLNDAKKISEKTVTALRCLPEKKVRVVIASARPPRSVRAIYSSLRLDTWQINYNGALIWDEPERRPVFHRPMDGSLMRQIVDVARAAFDQVLVSCEILDKWFTDRSDHTYTTETGRMFAPDVTAPLDTFSDQPITKLMLLGDPAIILSLESLLRDQFTDRVTVLRADDDLLQIMDRHVSKAVALKTVADHYEIPAEQVMAIGDAPNDVGMLRYAGIGVAMDNAHESVKSAANWIAPSNNEHGVHAALVRYGLCE